MFYVFINTIDKNTKQTYGLWAMVSVKQLVYGCVEKIYSKILNKYNMGTNIPL